MCFKTHWILRTMAPTKNFPNGNCRLKFRYVTQLGRGWDYFGPHKRQHWVRLLVHVRKNGGKIRLYHGQLFTYNDFFFFFATSHTTTVQTISRTATSCQSLTTGFVEIRRRDVSRRTHGVSWWSTNNFYSFFVRFLKKFNRPHCTYLTVDMQVREIYIFFLLNFHRYCVTADRVGNYYKIII